MSRLKGIADLFTPRSRRRAVTRRRKPSRPQTGGVRALESLESRAMLAVSYAYDDVRNTLTVNMTGSDNSAVIEFGVLADGPEADATRVLGARFSASGLTETVMVPVNAIVINVADPAVATNNRVSFGIIPFDSAFDLSSFVYEGNGASGSGHFTCQTTELKSTCSLNLTNIDAVSFSQADEIRLDGTFSNDTGDAEVGVVWQSFEPDVTEVIIGTNRPLVADSIRVESAKSITFFNPVTATSDLTLRSNSPLDIDYDIKAGGTLVLDGTDGVTQRASSTIVATALKVVSRDGTTTTGIVSLDSDLNDFDTVQISSDTSGQISLRDADDLVVSESGISADAGRVVLDVRGALTIASTILALGLNVQSGASVLATPTASMTLGADGLQIYATDSFDELATGDVTLNAPIHIQAADETKLVSNKIRSAGSTLIAGGLYVPSAGITTIEADGGLVVAGPVQVGSTKLDANSTTATVFDHDLTLVSHAGGITVEDVPGNDVVPSAIQATNIISFDATKTIDIRGAVFAGSRAGDATSRTASEALPAITIVGDAAVVIADTGSLQTQAYENDAATFANPLLGRISIDAATQFDLQGAIRADGPVDVSSAGDVYLYGPLTARESVAVETSRGSIDVQGAVRTTGWTYTSEPPAVLVAQRLPNIFLAAPGGGISTSGLGTLSAGVMTAGTGAAAATFAGDIELQAQQGIDLGAGIFGARDVRIASKVGAVAIQARLVTGSEGSTSINADAGVSILEFGAIESPIVKVINSTTGDVALVSQGNKIATLDIVNHAESGLVGVFVDGATTVSQLRADGDVTIGGSGLLTVAGVLSSGNGGIRLDLQSGLLQKDASGLSSIAVIAGGRGYGPNATLTIAAPQGGGRAATAVPLINSFGVVTGAVLTDPGSGYGIGEKPPVTLDGGDGDGNGAAFDASGPSSLGGILAKTDILIESRGDVTILGTVASNEQGIQITLAEGNVVLGASSLLTAQGPATLEAVAGGVSVGGDIRADAVNVNITSGAFTVFDNAEIVATAQSIQVSLANQSEATISGDMVAERDITVVGQIAAVSVTGLLEAKNGDIKIETLAVTQSTETGITKLEVLSGGRGYDLGAIILVPPPTSGTGRPARAEAVIVDGSIVSVTIVDPGSGYAVGQKIRIAVQGIQGPPSKDGPGAPGGQGAVVLAYGPTAVKDLTARNGNITILANQDVALSSQLLASKLIEVLSKHGTVDLSASSSFLNVLDSAGEVVVKADQGAVKINRAEAGGDITLKAQGDVAFSGRIITANGDFLATSELTQAVFKGAEVFAEKGSFGVVAGGYVLQESDSGIAKLEIVSGGQGYSEDTALEIAAPRNGGVPATAVLTIGENGVIVGVTITNSGSGYEPGESPEVKIVDPVSEGGFNGFLRAFGPENVRQVKAKNIDIEAGLGVRLGTTFEAVDGNLTVVSKSGTVDLGVGSVSLNASDSVIVTAEDGNVVVQRITAGKGVDLAANLTTKVLGRVVANGVEGIQIESTLGQVVVANTLLAKAGAILVNAGGTFEQRNESGITGIEVLNAGNGYSREVKIEIAAPRNGGIAARAVPILDDRGGIARVLVIDRGSGYEIGESPAVTVVEASAGPDGNGGVNAALNAVAPSQQYDIEAQLGIDIKANLGVKGGGGLISQSRGIEVIATSGTVDFSQGAAFLRALDPENGVVTIQAPEGLVLAPQSSVGKSLAVLASGGVIVNGDLVGVEDAVETNVLLSSSRGVVDLSAGDVAIDGQLKIVGSRVRQLGASGVQKLRIASGGEQYTQRVNIEIDPPASGFGRAAKATAIVQQGVIVDTVITDPGSGYAIGESPLVTVRGETQFNNGNPFEVGAGAAIFAVGPTEIRDVRADAGVDIVSVGDVALSSQFRSNSGAFKVQSSLGDIDLAEGSFVADANGMSVLATLGSVKVELLNAGNDGVKIEAGGAVDLNGGLLSVGDVTIASRLGNIDITGAAISVEDGDLTLAAADGGVIQQETTGIAQIELIEGGEGYFSGATVTVAAPSAPGGRQATAEAVVRAGRIVRIVVTDPGSGYAPGEQPRVTIQGENGDNGSPEGRGAVALARAPGAVRNISALNGTVRVQSGADSSLTSIFTARDIEVSSARGDVNLGGGTLFLNAVGGSVVASADRGRVSVRRISAGTDVTLTGHVDVTVSSRVDATNGSITVNSAGGGMTLRNFLAGEQINAVALSNTSLEGYFKSASNDIAVESTFGAILLNADLKADAGAVRLAAFSDVYQISSTGITAIEVTAQGDGFRFGAQVVVAPPRNNPEGLAARAQANVRRVDFVVGLETITRWFIESIDIVFPGVGYAIGENPDVQILLLDDAGDPVGSGGAEARATGPTGPRKITAAEDIEVTAGGKVTFVQPLESSNGNIAVRTTGGELNVGATQLIAHEGGVVVDATVGSALVNDVLAKTDIVIKSREALQLTGLIDTAVGSVEIISFAGDVVFKDGAVIHADLGDVTLASPNGQVSAPPVLNVGGSVDISSFKTLRLESEIVAATGDVDVNVASGSLLFSGNIVASTGSVSLRSDSATVTQVDSSGIRFITVLAGGSNYTGDVRVVIAAPAGGGVTAEARATVGTAKDGTVGAILEITITNPGSGYAVNESPAVTITPANQGQGSGAVALATGPSGLANVLGWNGVTIAGAGGVALVSAVRSPTGDITIQSTSGNLDLSADTFLAHAVAGGVTLTSSAGAVAVQQVTADDAVSISGARGVEIEGLVNSATGSVTVDATAGEAMIHTILAGNGVTVGASHDVTLQGTISADDGDISITSRNRDLDFTAAGAQLNALQGGVNLAAVNGTIMSPPTLHASKDVTLTSFNTLALNNEITSDTGVIDLKSTSGSINLGANLDARDDSIRIHAKGSVTQIGGGIGFVRVLNGGSGYTAAATVAIAAPSGGGVAARGEPIIGRVNGVNGVITGIRITNPGSGYGAGEQPTVTFTRNAVPPPGALDASAMAVASPALGNSGLAAIDVLDGGSGYTATTIVTIAAPVGGGTAATAQAVIGTVEVNGVMRDGVILDIVIVNPGSGYGAGEQPVVTITGAGTGAVARAIANIALQDIRGGKDIDIYAGTGVTLLNTIRADQGHVSITSETGNVNLAARTLLVSSFMDDIEITSRRGAVNVQRLAAAGDIAVKAQTGVTLLNAVNSTGDFGPGDVSIYTVNGNIAAVAPNGLISVQNGGVSLESVNGTILVPQVFNVTGDVSLKTFGNLTIDRPLTSSAGSVTLASATGAVNIAANVFADERVTLAAKTGISQTKGFLKGDELVASNSTTSAVNLTNPANDFANVSLMSLGAVSYVDANDFETGVERSPYSGMPLGVEVRGESLNLSSVGTNSRIRVVSGLSYKTLSIAAGTQGGNNVGYVEYVTTSTGDNPQANAAFRGTLRDMIRYVNDNTATYVNAGNTRVPQPQMMVFDETGYLVEEVAPAAALPAFSRPVWFDGGRLEETATANRLGISGNNSLLHGLSFAAATPAVTGVRPATPGSAGSRVESLAVYGFTKGSGVVLGSGNNTVVDMHAGLKADGTVSANMIGLDVRGAAAINNTIGEQVVDAETVNRFAGNTLAGIMIRSGAAGTQVFGSVIGDDTGANPALANGDGIQIVNATRSQIGSANAVDDDLYATRSNIIAGNLSAGVRISNAVAGTLAAANVVRNNVIRGNRTGVEISASAFAVLGGPDAGAANVITGQTLSGVVVTDSRSVQIQGNRIGIMAAYGDEPEAVAGNGVDGIAISGKSQGVEIGGGNWIGGNTAHGVRIGTGVTGVMMTGNRIGGELSDGSTAGNGQDGVAITAAIGNTIGAGNVIARNGRHGVSITDARAETLLAGNRVFGSTISGNQSNGVLLGGGSRTTIGGPTVADANLIQGNVGDGVRLVSTSVTGAATGHVIQRNYVGSNPAGDVNTELGNKGSGIALVGTSDVVVGDANVVMNNGVDGIAVNGGRGVTIGSAIAAVGNQIRSNARHGVSFNGAATGGRVMGNLIEGQGGDGVFVGSGARDVRIGHIVTQSGVTGAANVLRENSGWGVRVMPGAQRIAVQGNSSFGNMQGALSRAAGANAAAPSSVTLTSAVMRTATGGTRQLVVTGTIAGARARQQYSVDVYASSVGESAQGRRHLGRFNVTATADGQLSFNSTITATVAVDELISVAATTLVFDPGSTSQLSAPVRAALRR